MAIDQTPEVTPTFPLTRPQALGHDRFHTGVGSPDRWPGSDRPSSTSLASYAYGQIKDRLIMLDILPGAPINDIELATDLGVGRTPIREALKRLETDHLVVSYPRRGTFATPVDATELGAISDIRQTLEPLAARRAAENATPSLRIEIHELAVALQDLHVHDGDRGAFIAEDMAIHQLIYRATGNAHLHDVLERYDNLATRIWCLVIDRLPEIEAHIRDHSPLLKAIADGEADLAAELALAHVTKFEEAIRTAL